MANSSIKYNGGKVMLQEEKLTALQGDGKDFLPSLSRTDLYNSFIKDSPEGFLLINKDFDILETNDAFCDLSGYNQDELLSMNLRDIDVELLKNPDNAKEIINQRINNKGNYLEFQHRRKDGSIIDVSIRTQYLADFPDHFLCFHRDVTEQRRLERLLRESEEKYRNLFQNVPIPATARDFSKVKKVFDALKLQGVTDFKEHFKQNPNQMYKCLKQARHIDINKAFLKFLEVKSKKQSEKWYSDRVGPYINSWGAWLDILSNLAEGKTRFRIEYQIDTAEEYIKSIYIIVMVDPNCVNSLSLVYFSIIDISELKESQNLYRSLVDLGSDAGEAIIMTQDINGKEGLITFVNSEFIRLTGYSKTQLMKMTICDLISPKYRKAFIDRQQRKMNGEPLPGLYEASIICSNGSEVPVELTSAVTVYKGDPANVIYLRDITERKKSEKILIETKSQLDAIKNSESMMHEFQAIVSHEIRTPLAAIKGFANSLMQKDVTWSEEEKADFIHEIDAEADRLSEIVKDLLYYSSMKMNNSNYKKNICSVNEIFNESYQMLKEIAKDHLLSIITADTLPSVKVNKNKISQVIINLVDNAVKFSPQGSPITIEAKTLNNSVIFSVSDEGIGIPKKEQGSIFDRFHQARMIASGAKKGTGLGLSICKIIIEAHNGKIWLESKQGMGSTFYFSIPVAI